MPTRPIEENPFAAPESDLTPERFEPGDVSSAYATTWKRVVAVFVDGIILKVLSAAVFMAVLAVSSPADSPAIESFFELLDLGLPLLMYLAYYTVLESSEAQATLGKRLVGIRVTDLEGRRLSFGRAFGRACARFLSYLSFGIGLLIQPFTERKQALHDLLAGTIVVRG